MRQREINPRENGEEIEIERTNSERQVKRGLCGEARIKIRTI